MMIRVVLATAPVGEAEELARRLLDERLIACANLLPAAKSIYRWEGKTETTEETVLVMKTDARLTRKLIKRLRDLHSYEVPEILLLTVKDGNPRYLRWVRAETIGPRRAKKKGGKRKKKSAEAREKTP